MPNKQIDTGSVQSTRALTIRVPTRRSVRRALDASLAERLGMKGVGGLVFTSVRSGSIAEQSGLESGMVITQINRQPVATRKIDRRV